MDDTGTRTRAGRGARGRRPAGPQTAGVVAGRFLPLGAGDVARIDAAAREILGRIGLSGAPPALAALAVARGARITGEGRLCLPPALVEEALAGLRRGFTLAGRVPGHELRLEGARVHCGSGGAAPMVLDLAAGRLRDSVLRDLHDAARLVDALEHVHFFSRSVVARDMPDERLLDLNTAFASLAGTGKHVMTSVSRPAHVAEVAEMCFLVAGGAAAFRAAPFLSLNVNHVTPPLRLAPEACEVLAEAARLGIPVHCNTFGQMGASSPVTMAGCLAQTMAETLAGVILAWLVNPEVLAVFGPRPMVTDLRTGAMSGGSGEQALLMAAAVQMARHYGLANSCIAGATDAKAPDAQSGWEKALTVALAAQAGANLVTQAAGMQAGLMAAAFESYVLDNDMIGAVLSAARAPEVDAETLALDAIDAVARGEGHFLGRPETLARMESDFLYPRIADRRPPAVWEAGGSEDIRVAARERAGALLAGHRPPDLPGAAEIRARFPIRLEVP